MNSSGPVIDHRAEALVPLYVFDRVDFARPDNGAAVGWYRVGLDSRLPLGYVQAANVLEWRIPLLASYAKRDRDRDYVPFFKSLAGVETAIGGTTPSLKQGQLLRKHEHAQDAGVIAREPEGHKSGAGLDLLPVVQSVDIESFGVRDGWLLQVALPTSPDMGIHRRLCPAPGCGRELPSAFVEFLDLQRRQTAGAHLAWTTDFDLVKRDVKALALHVLLTKSQMIDLKRNLMEFLTDVRLNRLDMWLDRSPRLQVERERTPPSPEEQRKREQYELDQNRLLTDSMPAWLQALPRRSEFAGLTKAQLGSLSPAAQARFEHRLLKVIDEIRQALARSELWWSVPDTPDDDEDRLIVWPLARLP